MNCVLIFSDGCITRIPNDALRSVVASQSISKLTDWSTASAVDLGSYFTLGVECQETPESSPVPLSFRTPRPLSSRARVSNQCMHLTSLFFRWILWPVSLCLCKIAEAGFYMLDVFMMP